MTDLSPRQGDSEPPRPVWRPVRPNSLITRLQMSRTSGNVNSYGITINLCRQMLPIPEMSSIVINLCHQMSSIPKMSSIVINLCHQLSSIPKMSSIVINLCHQLSSIFLKSVSVFGYCRVARESESKSNSRYLEAQTVLSDLRR